MSLCDIKCNINSLNKDLGWLCEENIVHNIFWHGNLTWWVALDMLLKCKCVFVCGGVKFNMEQRRREQEHHEKQQELQQLKHKDKSQQSEYIHTRTLNFNLTTGFTLHLKFVHFFSHLSLYKAISTSLKIIKSWSEREVPVRELIHLYWSVQSCLL